MSKERTEEIMYSMFYFMTDEYGLKKTLEILKINSGLELTKEELDYLTRGCIYD